MPWFTEHFGRKEFPYPFAMKRQVKDYDDVCQLYQKLFDHAQSQEQLIISLKDTISRLTHENEFMLKLINSRDNGDV